MTRRELLKTGAVTAAIALVSGCVTASAARQDPPPKPRRVWDGCALGYDMPIPPVPRVRAVPGEAVLTPGQAADILAIRHLQQTYGQLHEHGTADEIAELFAEDAELHCIYLGSRGFRGRRQIRDWYAFWLPYYAEIGHYYRHRPVNQVVDLDGDRAVSNAILVADGAPRGKDAYDRCWGRYTHQVVRGADGWRFHRSWIAIHLSTAWSPRTPLAPG